MLTPRAERVYTRGMKTNTNDSIGLLHSALAYNNLVAFAYRRKDGKWRSVIGSVEAIGQDHVILFDEYRHDIRRFNFDQMISPVTSL